MRGRAAWILLLIAAAVAGYLAGARGGEGPGTRAPRESPRLADAPPKLQNGNASSPPRSDTPPAEETRAPETVAPEAPGGAAPTEAAGWPDLVRAGSPLDARLRDDLDRGGPMGFLRGVLREQEGRPWTIVTAEGVAAIVRDGDTFARIFEPRKEGPVVAGPGADWGALADGTTLAYPEGVFEIRWNSAPRRFPRDLVLKGAGMDRTLFRVNGLRGWKDDEIQGLTLVDATIDCRGGDLLRPKSGLAALKLLRCRVVRTDTVLFDVDAGALKAEACELDGARLLAANRGLARLDGCTIRGTLTTHDGGHVACLLRRCTFVEAHPNLQSNLERRPGVRLERCRFEVRAGDLRPRPLASINPAWAD